MPIRLGIVGCGAITDAMHIPTALHVPEVHLAALVDVRDQECKRLAKKYHVERTATHLEQVAKELDAVIIATPPHVRREIAEKAFAEGLHVLCEKPLANTVAECETMTESASQADRILSVGHMFRFYPIRGQLHDLIAKHELGRVVRVVASEGKPYSWQTVTGYTVRKDMVPGGVLINAGVHTLDSLLWWFGDPVDIRYEDDSAGGLESNVRLWMTFPEGIKGYFRQSRTCLLPYRICVEAENGRLSFATNGISEYCVEMDGRQQTFTCADPHVDQKECWAKQLNDFAESITLKRSPLVTGQEGARVIKLIEECYQAKRNRPLPVKTLAPGLTW